MDKFWVRIFCYWQGEKRRHSSAKASIFNAGSRKKGKPKMYIYLAAIPQYSLIELLILKKLRINKVL